ncbi:MAG: hypothetical protein KDC79_03690 [Cyclobacteriaceae bacterium]|nr:hypothetical protein [Cyclobacteriaceae bacterium]
MEKFSLYKKTILVIVTLILVTGVTYAQTFMVLEKMGTKKRHVYYMGETIEYRLKGQKEFTSDQITNILDSAFVTQSDSIPFKSIDRINIKPKRRATLLNVAGPYLIIAGLGLTAIDLINRGVVQGGDASWDSSIGTISGILVGTGALVMILQKNKIPLDGWWRLRKVSVY